MLAVGKKAPDFTLPNQNGEDVSLSEFIGKWVVVYFYPKALTPGCTTQACALTDVMGEYKKLNTEVLGISADKTSLLKRFQEKKNLNFTLLGDESTEMLQAYEAWGDKKFMGKEYKGIFRVTYIINPQGEIAHTIEKVNTKTHHEEVLNWLKEHI